MFRNLIILALCIIPSLCWWEVGHMLTAQIAKNELLRINHTIYNRVSELVKSINHLCSNQSQDFVQAASWADDIKNTPGMDFWNIWHFYDRPYNPEGLFILYNDTGAAINSVDSMNRTLYVLANDTGNFTIQKALMVRFAIHLVGDIHQPLHNTQLFNDTFLQGDQGGNLVNVTLMNGSQTLLHSYWDAGAFILEPSADYIVRPLNKTAYKKLEDMASEVELKYPRKYFGDRLLIKDPFQWTSESYNLATKYVYPFFEDHENITVAYQDMALELIMQQIALGGYRLADFFLNAYVNYTNETEAFHPHEKKSKFLD